MRLGSLFTGGGGFDIGAREAGLELAWGVEYIPAIAAWANAQLGDHVRCLDILAADPADFEPVDWLHASPPCPSFSVANAKGGETAQDIALSAAVARFLAHRKPRYFSLENVLAYRGSVSWRTIRDELDRLGYGYTVEHINAADFGVPQKRRRMIVRAVKGAFFHPAPMRPTHAEGGAGGLLPWVGWWEAVADIAHTFPESKLAPWQVKRLGISEGLYQASNTSQARVRAPAEPCETIISSGDKVSVGMYRAILVNTNQSGDDGADVCTVGDGPAFTTKTADLGRLRAVLVDNQTDGTRREIITVEGSAPDGALKASGGGRLARAVLVEGNVGGDRPPTLFCETEPGPTLEAGAGGRLRRAILGNGSNSDLTAEVNPSDTITAHWNQNQIRLLEGTRVVALTPRALARFQTFPDWYELPAKKTLAVTLIGNAVPCLLARRIVESLL